MIDLTAARDFSDATREDLEQRVAELCDELAGWRRLFREVLNESASVQVDHQQADR